MRRFITAGMVGTAQTGGEIPPDDAPTEVMVASLALDSVERAYLLRAGASAVRLAAGYQPIHLDNAPVAAEIDARPFCGPAVVLLIATCARSEPLLVVALDRLRRSGQTLAPELLPTILAIRSGDVREAAKPVLGARGRWLARFNPEWRWAAGEPLGAVDELVGDVESRWLEGSTDQRVEALRWLRAARPDQAREWLVATWKREKADARADLLNTLAIGLSLQDEPLLESALDDRAAAVRDAARNLLAALPESGFSRRMRERAEQMLFLAEGGVDAKPPAKIPPDWQRDGIGLKPVAGRGERVSWLAAVLSLVPCAVWSDRFGLSPDDLVMAVSTSRWSEAVLEGWTRAAATFKDADWSLVLWRRWAAHASQGDSRADRDTLRDLVAPCVPAPELEAHAAAYFNAQSNPGSATFEEALNALPTPWSVTFGHSFLHALRSFVETLDPAATDVAQWDSAIPVASLALPDACFATALEPLNIPDSPQWRIRALHHQLGEFVDTIRLRQQLNEEIPLP